jgi:Pentapeptide repeats (8 copies)
MHGFTIHELTLLTVGLLVLGLVIAVVALGLAFRSNDQKNAAVAGVRGGLSAGVLTGAAVAVGVLVLQGWLADSSEEIVWRTSVETASDIPGFSPGHHILRGLNLSGKRLEDADLRGKNLRGVQLRDTDLRGADLRGAHLQGANLIGANLAATELEGANLSGAQLQATRFDNAEVEHAIFAEFNKKKHKWVRAVANASTCWPEAFFKDATGAKQIEAKFDQNYKKLLISGRVQPDCSSKTHWPKSLLSP